VTVTEARALRREGDRFGVEPAAATFGRLHSYLSVVDPWRRSMRRGDHADGWAATIATGVSVERLNAAALVSRETST